MKLKESARTLLEEIYRHYQETGDLTVQLTYSENPLEKRAELQSIEQLSLADYVVQVAPASGWTTLKLTKAGIDYIEGSVPPQAPVVNNFHVAGNVENSILGNQNNATINVGSELSQIESLLASISGPDKALLSSLPQELAEIKRQKTVEAGALSKFSGMLGKYPKLFDLVGSLLVKLALGSFG